MNGAGGNVSDGVNRAGRIAMGAAGALLAGLTLARVAECWPPDSHLEHVAGVWVAAAVDFSQGIFYRAPYGPGGFGGSRYFPFFFTLHGLLIRIFGDWRWTGYALSAASVALLLVGVYCLCRRLGAGAWLAMGAAATVLAGTSVQDALLTIREDATAAALNVWGLALCAEENPSARRLASAAALFTLAFATKETTIFGAAAVCLWLAFNGRWQSALRLAAFTAAGYVVVMAVIGLASGGRAIEAFRLTAVSGFDLRALASSPVTMMGEMEGYTAEIVMLALGFAALLAAGLPGRRRMGTLLFACTLGVTLAIFSTDGAAGNHVMDLLVAAVVLAAEWAASAGAQELATGAAAGVCLVAWLALMASHAAVDMAPVWTQMQEVVREIGPTDKPIIAENPLIAIEAGQRPYLEDPFSFRVMMDRDPDLGDDMWQKMSEHGFAAVVFLHDPRAAEWQDFYTGTHFGEDFLEHLQKDYRLAGTPGGEYLYLPKREAEAGR